ncbi:MAG: malate dehydrogenase, partial [Saprospiraceae bacterium]|nr:malate dehydrogenase [Saprospiraceae bacterium]
GIPVTELIGQEELDAIIARTQTGGGELVKLMGTSAWYAPGAAAAQMVASIVRDENRVFPCCALLNGQYGLSDIFLGVPVKLGKQGISELLELKLNEQELQMLRTSAGHVRGVIDVFNQMGIN